MDSVVTDLMDHHAALPIFSIAGELDGTKKQIGIHATL